MSALPASQATSQPASDQTRRRIAAFMRGFSLEATRPNAADRAALKEAAPPGTAVYLSALPKRPHRELAGHCADIVAAGYAAVPHIAARNYASSAELDDLIAHVAGNGVRTALVIAGDRERPAGPFATALDVIEGGLLQRHGIEAVGISGYPDGHPRVTAEVLERAMMAKIDAAEQTGLKVHIVTQFCFDAGAIVRWLKRLRDLGIEQEVRIGMAGPTSLAALVRYAQRCGVRTSASGLVRHSGLARNMFSTSAPDAIIRGVVEANGGALGDIAAHFYSFGGLGAAARWAAAAAAGWINLDGGEGFAVAAR